MKVTNGKVQAVTEMAEPESIANIRTLLGMMTYTCKFLLNLSTVTEPLRNLIKGSNEERFKFHFDEKHKEAVKKIKKMMTTTPVLKYYSTTEPLTISSDASQAGLGAVLMLDDRPVAYTSKSLTETEKHGYSQIEKEMLAIVFAFKKFYIYLCGRSDITVETDHLPLVRIFKKPLHQVPLRLQKMRMTLQHYDFKLIGKSGKDIPVADALSRAFLPSTEEKLMAEDNYVKAYAIEVRGVNAFSGERQEELLEETNTDPVLQKLKMSYGKDGP